MVWLEPYRFRSRTCALVLSLAGGVTLAAPSALADMQVLASNVAKYPRDLVLRGSTIEDLKRGQWVRVLMLETDKTRYFGDPPPYVDRHGTRRLRRPKE